MIRLRTCEGVHEATKHLLAGQLPLKVNFNSSEQPFWDRFWMNFAKFDAKMIRLRACEGVYEATKHLFACQTPRKGILTALSKHFGIVFGSILKDFSIKFALVNEAGSRCVFWVQFLLRKARILPPSRFQNKIMLGHKLFWCKADFCTTLAVF